MISGKKIRFSVRTNRSMILWLLVAFGIVITPRVLKNFIPKEHIEITTIQEKKIDSYKKNYKFKSFSFKNRFKRPPKKFNPNDYSLEQWMYLGLSSKQANCVLKFCRYPLKSNEDLKKIFVIPSKLYVLIEDSTFYSKEIHFTKTPFTANNKSTEKRKLICSEIDSSNLVGIKGIGPFYAKVVSKYAKILGGFYQKEQLLEVYKMNPNTYSILIENIDFTQPKILKMSINYSTTDELNKHPYLNWSQANSIVKMRNQRGRFTTIEEIKQSHLITPEIFEKLVPYLSL